MPRHHAERAGEALARSVGRAVDIGGAFVRDGDIVIADDDGVVMWPRELVGELLERAKARLASDEERLAKIRAR